MTTAIQKRKVQMPRTCLKKEGLEETNILFIIIKVLRYSFIVKRQILFFSILKETVYFFKVSKSK